MSLWRKWLDSRAHERSLKPPAPHLDEVRRHLCAALQGCDGPVSERMRWRIVEALTAHDLWLLRGEIFQLVADEFHQEEAARRINALLPAFSGWLPDRMLTRV